jgi:hypothetical protein
MGGTPFKDLPRPALNTTTCPTGTVACPGAASANPLNMVCLPLADHAAKCPITDIIFTKGGYIPFGYSSSKTFVNGYTVAMSKTAKDNLPI